jgi:23S rRNA (guanosine2251-2'-O)-methyltransferase
MPIIKTSNSDLNRLSLEAFKAIEKVPIVIVLDNIRSFHNVGAVFRTADSFAIEAIYLCGYTPTPPHREIHKTALGASESVNWQYFQKTEQAIEHLKNNGFTVVGIEQASPHISLPRFTLSGKLAVVFGSEVGGIDDNVLPNLDACVEIPQAGTKHSLNISVAVGIVLWQLIGK